MRLISLVEENPVAVKEDPAAVNPVVVNKAVAAKKAEGKEVSLGGEAEAIRTAVEATAVNKRRRSLARRTNSPQDIPNEASV